MINGVTVAESRLRWPVSDQVANLAGEQVTQVGRRAKYILLSLNSGATLIIHLGMSGSLRICEAGISLRKHDHVILRMDSGLELRYHDPRRFGCWLWTDQDPYLHPLLASLGPEPIGPDFTTAHLVAKCKSRSSSIKQVIMDAKTVVGVGNIYASEALFLAGINPRRKAGRISTKRLAALVTCIQSVLEKSIQQGGTTLRDFLREDGQPGYFKQQLRVYDREGKPCVKCGSSIKRVILGQRATYYCSRCQH